MNEKDILIIGGGGREHAIAWKLKESPRVGKVYCIPGNAGIAEIAECRPDIKACDFTAILEFLKERKKDGKGIYMTVVAPDDPLAGGLVDLLTENGFRAFGPVKAAAQIEASKVFSKNLMKKYGIPTAAYASFDDYGDALRCVRDPSVKYPLVVKADGLALGKGVFICSNVADAEVALDDIMREKRFGGAGGMVVIEEFLRGREVSVLAFCDGDTAIPMFPSRDHKRAFDGDEGPNTGGMGAVAPPFDFNFKLLPVIVRDIIKPTVEAMKREGRPFKGVLYFGLMLDGGDVKVLEYNARFGDPETQSLLPLLDEDLLDIFDRVIDGRLNGMKIRWKRGASCCVVLASGGYPSDYKKGKEIKIGAVDKDVLLFHGGTVRDAGGKLVTSGGRVMGVTAVAPAPDAARKKAYAAVSKIKFDGMFYRRDIGAE